MRLAAVLLAAGCCASLPRGGLASTPAPAAAEPDAWTLLRGQDTDEHVRLGAAISVIRGAESPQEQRRILEMLSGGEPAAAAAVLRAIAAEPIPSPELERAVRGVLDRTDAGALRPLAASALRSFRSSRGVRRLAMAARSDADPAVRQAASEALMRLSRSATPEAALEWASRWEHADDAALLRELLAHEIVARRGLESENTGLRSAMLEGYRRLHLATPPEERSALLAEYLRHARGEVRDLGFELAARELSASNRLGADVAAAGFTLLQHADPAVRAQAAILVNRMAPEGGADRVVDALLAEWSPRAAEPMLLAVSRAPRAEAAEPVLRWLSQVDGPRAAAADAAWALLRAEKLSEAQRERLLSEVRSAVDGRLTPHGARILATLGTAEDLDRLAAAADGEPGLPLAALTEALALRAEGVPRLLSLAERRPEVLAAAANAIAQHGGTGADLARLAQAAGNEAQRADALRRAAAGLPLGELLAALGEGWTDFALGADLLSAALAAPRGESLPPLETALVRGAWLRVGELRSLSGNAEQALAAVEKWAGFADAAAEEAERAARTRLIALVGLGRLDEAWTLGRPLADWLTACESMRTTPHAGPAAARALERFASEMDDAARAKLQALLPAVGQGGLDADGAGAGGGEVQGG